MNKALERIWAFHDGPLVGYFVGKSPGEGLYVNEYVRADRIKELEAKLAQAVEALREIASGPDHNTDAKIARATLAELKGGDA